MNTGLASEAEQFDWLASQLSGANARPVALFLHKPLFLNSLRAGVSLAAIGWPVKNLWWQMRIAIAPGLTM